MKKAKIMLLSIAILAVVGGALAFKAEKFNLVYCYDSQNTPPNAMSTTLPQFCQSEKRTTTMPNGAFLSYATTKPPGGCPAITKCPAVHPVIE